MKSLPNTKYSNAIENYSDKLLRIHLNNYNEKH